MMRDHAKGGGGVATYSVVQGFGFRLSISRLSQYQPNAYDVTVSMAIITIIV